MSSELANRFERDLSASEETQERALLARDRGAALDVDWVEAIAAYREYSDRDPKQIVRFVESDTAVPEVGSLRWERGDESSNDDRRESTASQ